MTENVAFINSFSQQSLQEQPFLLNDCPTELVIKILSYVGNPWIIPKVCHFWRNLSLDINYEMLTRLFQRVPAFSKWQAQLDHELQYLQEQEDSLIQEKAYQYDVLLTNVLSPMIDAIRKEVLGACSCWGYIYGVGFREGSVEQMNAVLYPNQTTLLNVTDYLYTLSAYIENCNLCVLFEAVQGQDDQIQLSLVEGSVEEQAQVYRGYFLNPDNARIFLQIKKLHISNKLTRIPREICFLRGLQELNVSENLISYIPEEIGELRALQKLDLSGNQIRTIPAAIQYLSSLLELDLSFNQITEIPRLDIIRRLKVLDLSGNRM
ncbi:MAG: leucine-rich repeat domain-containing protein [Parachlamydiales bacterium]|nr:leucine-rich repeat domain-containing protein [Parachlamydiales bacterium]